MKNAEKMCVKVYWKWLVNVFILPISQFTALPAAHKQQFYGHLIARADGAARRRGPGRCKPRTGADSVLHAQSWCVRLDLAPPGVAGALGIAT